MAVNVSLVDSVLTVAFDDMSDDTLSLSIGSTGFSTTGALLASRSGTVSRVVVTDAGTSKTSHFTLDYANQVLSSGFVVDANVDSATIAAALSTAGGAITVDASKVTLIGATIDSGAASQSFGGDVIVRNDATITTQNGVSFSREVTGASSDRGWPTRAGSVRNDSAGAISTFADGSSIITGSFQGNATFGGTTLISSNQAIFVTKIDADGNYLWARKADGTYSDAGTAIATFGDGSAVITGYFEGSISFGNTILTSTNAFKDIFVAKISAEGDFVWATRAGGLGYFDSGTAISALPDGSSVVAGIFSGQASFGNTTLLNQFGLPDPDIFIAKLDPTGNFVWAKQAGGDFLQRVEGICSFTDGSLAIAGWFEETATFGNTSLSSRGSTDIFVCKLDAAGNFLWVTQAGGPNTDHTNAIAATADGSIRITGFTGEGTFGTISVAGHTGEKAFVSKVNSAGGFDWVTQPTGNNWSGGESVIVMTDGSAMISGWFGGPGFGPSQLTFGSSTIAGSTSGSYENDGFLAKIDGGGTWMWAAATEDAPVNSISLFADGSVVATGTFGPHSGFDGVAGFGSSTVATMGSRDIFVAKLLANGQWAATAGIPPLLPALVISSGGTTAFSGDISNLARLTTDANVVRIGGDITTVSDQAFSGNVLFTADVTLQSTHLHFAGSVDGGGNNLVLRSASRSGTPFSAFTNYASLVLDQLDSGTPSDISLPITSIAENRPIGTVVGTLNTTDPDANDVFTYTLVAGTGSTDNSSFSIQGNQLRTAASFDFESKSSYSVRIRSTDQGGLFTEKVFAISVTDVIETPTAPVFETKLVSPGLGGKGDSGYWVEDTVAFDGSRIASYVASTNGTVRLWTLDASNNLTQVRDFVSPHTTHNHASFGYSLLLNGDLLGVGSPYTYIGGAHDGRFYIYDATTGAAVTSFNPQPHWAQYFGHTAMLLPDNRFVVAESGNSGFDSEAALTFYSYDPATLQPTMFTRDVLSSAGVGSSSFTSRFATVGNMVVGAYYLETENRYVLQTWTVNRSGATLSASRSQSYTASSGHLLNGRMLATNGKVVAVAQPNPSGGSVQLFTIDQTTGAISHSQTIAAPASAGGYFAESILFQGDTLFVGVPQELGNSSGTGKVYAYPITPGAGAGAPLVFTPPSLSAGERFGQHLVASGDRLLVSSNADTLYVYDISHLPQNATPAYIALSATSIAENQPSGTAVGTFTTTDPDVSETFIYSLVSGTGSADNNSFTIVGDQLQAAVPFDYETKSSYSVRVRATDSAGAFTEQAVTITVVNLGEGVPNLQQGLLGLYQLDGNALDSSGNGRNGTATNTTPTKDRFGTANAAMSFNGIDSVVTVPHNTAFNALPLSISLWFQTKDYGGLVGKYMAAGWNGYQVEVNPNGEVWPWYVLSRGQDVIGNNDVAGDNNPAFRSAPLNDGRWHNIVFTVDQSGGALFVDGALRATKEWRGDPTVVTTTLPLFIGQYFGSPSVFFKGSIDDVRLYDRVLSPAEVLMLNNQAPTNIVLSPAFVSENQPSNTVVGTFSTTDPDVGNTFTYSLVSGVGSADNGSFTIVGDQLRTTASFDFERKPTYSIRVRTTDQGGLFLEKALTVSVTNLNENPINVLLNGGVVPENVARGSLVGTFAAFDPDANDSFTFAFEPSASATAALENRFTPWMPQAEFLPYFRNQNDALGMYPILLEGRLQNGVQQYRAVFHQRPSSPSSDFYYYTTWGTPEADAANENQLYASRGYRILHQQSFKNGSNADIFQTVWVRQDQLALAQAQRTTLVGDIPTLDNASFRIDGNRLLTAAPLDFEATQSYRIRVRATDAGGLSVVRELDVRVGDLPEAAPVFNMAPTAIVLSGGTVPENSPVATVAGTLRGIDPNASDVLTYSLVPAKASEIQATPWMKQGAFLALYQARNASSQFPLVIEGRVNAGSWEYRGVFRQWPAGGIEYWVEWGRYKDKSDQIGAGLQSQGYQLLSQTTFKDDGNYDVFQTVWVRNGIDAARQAKQALDATVFTNDNALFDIRGNQLRTKDVFDFERRRDYTVRVRATDQGGLFTESDLRIAVTNANDAPTDIRLSNASVPENSLPDTVVGSFSAIDPDPGSRFTYALVSGIGSTDNGRFAIRNTGALVATTPFDFEQKNSYSVRVRVTDNGSPALSFEKPFTIAVADVNEAPTAVTLQNSVSSLPEQALPVVRTKIADIVVADDAVKTNTIWLGGRDAAAFELVGATLCLRAGVRLDHEVKPTFEVTVFAQDRTISSSKPLSVTHVLAVTNVNEAPTSLSLAGGSVAESMPTGTVAGTFSTSDPDAGNTFTYSLVAGTGATDNGAFRIEGNRLLTNAVFDFETKRSYSIRVRSTDQGGLFTERNLLISVTDIAEGQFSYGFKHVNEVGAERYLVDSTGMRKYSEWQSTPITYWGPSANNVEGRLVYKFDLGGAAQSIRMKATSPSWDFFREPGGSGRGASALEVSRDGQTWISVRNSLEPRNWGADWSIDGLLPSSLAGTTTLWVRMRFLVENAPNSSYTTAQFGRSTAAATANVFEIDAKLG